MITMYQAVYCMSETHMFFQNSQQSLPFDDTPHLCVADVGFQGKEQKMKTVIIFQSCLKYLYWFYPKENLLFLMHFVLFLTESVWLKEHLY